MIFFFNSSKKSDYDIEKIKKEDYVLKTFLALTLGFVRKSNVNRNLKIKEITKKASIIINISISISYITFILFWGSIM